MLQKGALNGLENFVTNDLSFLQETVHVLDSLEEFLRTFEFELQEMEQERELAIKVINDHLEKTINKISDY